MARSPQDFADLEEEIRTLIERRIVDHGAPIETTAPLESIGVDSMAVIQLLLLIEKRFGIWLPESDLTRENLQSIRTLARAVERRLAERSSAA